VRAVFPLCGAALVLSVVGCGPLTTPMPARLNDDQQKQIDASWNAALTPVFKLDRRAVMDLMVLRYAFELGVDRLELKSEKDLASGKAVMEIHIDRTKPGDDRFDFYVLNKAGAEVRRERYTRAEVEATAQAFHDHGDLNNKKSQGTATAAELKRLAELDARVGVVDAAYAGMQGVPPFPGIRAEKDGDK